MFGNSSFFYIPSHLPRLIPISFHFTLPSLIRIQNVELKEIKRCLLYSKYRKIKMRYIDLIQRVSYGSI